ncbi:hypothetical protein MUK42_35791, partial [Musa troglodytarum]
RETQTEQSQEPEGPFCQILTVLSPLQEASIPATPVPVGFHARLQTRSVWPSNFWISLSSNSPSKSSISTAAPRRPQPPPIADDGEARFNRTKRFRVRIRGP